MRIYFTLTTIDPIIVSKNTATTTNHQGLDYIPGSALLGAVAASLYSELSEQESWLYFHSGHIQFGPCYPLNGDQLCLPTPASWHFDKLSSPIKNNRFLAGEITNHASNVFERKPDVQYKQCRNGYINTHGDIGEVKRGITTKTALNRASGIVESSALFSYSYIEAGQTFVGWVSCEQQEQLERLKPHLFGQKHIGRSKNTEFGRVNIQQQTTIADTQTHTSNDTLTLWCLSDCQCINQLGLPTLTPSLADLVSGAEGVLDDTKSFIRTTSTSRFNQARGGLDSEQALIAKGSVLVYNKPTITAEQMQHLASQGIGINRQQGLGWIYINPQWATEPTLSNKALFSPIHINSRQESGQEKNHRPSSPLTHWIASKVTKHQHENAVQQQATIIASQLVAAYDNARRYNHIPDNHRVGPTRTQWGRVANVLRNRTPDWQDKLFTKPHQICQTDNDPLGWGVQWQSDTQIISFSQNCKENWRDCNTDVLIQALEQLSQYDLSTLAGLNKAKSTAWFTKQISAQGASA